MGGSFIKSWDLATCSEDVGAGTGADCDERKRGKYRLGARGRGVSYCVSEVIL